MTSRAICTLGLAACIACGGGEESRDANALSCDVVEVASNGVAVFEAELLTLSDLWEVRSDEPGFTGSGYILWTGESQNNRPGSGVLTVELDIASAGRYQFHWYNRIGRGTNPTEHNDTWVQFPDALDYYGARPSATSESRRYPKPICDDSAEMAARLALGNVTDAGCAEGSTREGWLKVYSSGATDWRWSTRTSDNDAHDIFVEFDSPGTYTLLLSARGDFHLIDRVVLFEESVDSAVALDRALPPTCR